MVDLKKRKKERKKERKERKGERERERTKEKERKKERKHNNNNNNKLKQLCVCIRRAAIYRYIFYLVWFWGSKCKGNCKRKCFSVRILFTNVTLPYSMSHIIGVLNCSLQSKAYSKTHRCSWFKGWSSPLERYSWRALYRSCNSCCLSLHRRR